ncbi:hypothetical protein B0H19DRAFT_1242299 [Mycena capillaripes]|nr:hypothetical protein B0H19DRAFT_1242299 [Mycena capillaripes]
MFFPTGCSLEDRDGYWTCSRQFGWQHHWFLLGKTTLWLEDVVRRAGRSRVFSLTSYAAAVFMEGFLRIQKHYGGHCWGLKWWFGTQMKSRGQKSQTEDRLPAFQKEIVLPASSNPIQLCFLLFKNAPSPSWSLLNLDFFQATTRKQKHVWLTHRCSKTENQAAAKIRGKDVPRPHGDDKKTDNIQTDVPVQGQPQPTGARVGGGDVDIIRVGLPLYGDWRPDAVHARTKIRQDWVDGSMSICLNGYRLSVGGIARRATRSESGLTISPHRSDCDESAQTGAQLQGA